ncbi:MAG: hypothetical protein L0Y66_09395 [Myxococcaceae bacterium]|nr:hypothetical protein [Myxococcaceae bacterium]
MSHVGNRCVNAVLGPLVLLATVLVAPAPAHAATRYPVLLVAGLYSPASHLNTLKNRLQADGFAVYTMELPTLGTQDIALSAQAVGDKVNFVRAQTGAAWVDIVGHSEGGLASRYYLKFLGGTTKVARYVSLGTPQYGSYLNNIYYPSCSLVVACAQMAVGSAFLTTLNSGDDTPGSVKYTAFASTQDELVDPDAHSFLADGATNVYVQSLCPLRYVYHLDFLYDGAVYGMVRSALQEQPISTNCYAL